MTTNLTKRSALCRILSSSMILLGIPSIAQAEPSTSSAAVLGIQDYKLGTGDRVRIITYGEPSLTGEFQVSGVGTISLPLIGDIAANGSTTSELQAHITTALKNGYLNNPSVNVEVLGYRPFYILGEINKPGQYSYTVGATVMNAVATASGFTYRANKHRVVIKHGNAADSETVALDPNTQILPGDTVTILERHF